MHMPMNWGHHPHRRYTAAGMDLDVPLVPAPMVFFGMLAGMLIGMMVGYKKASMVQTHRRMMGGMGHGMMGGGMRGYGGDGDWMSRKRAMMQAMAGHHHHGYGAAPCCCGAENESSGMRQSAEDEERPDE